LQDDRENGVVFQTARGRNDSYGVGSAGVPVILGDEKLPDADDDIPVGVTIGRATAAIFPVSKQPPL
jgi:hypothetical protein